VKQTETLRLKTMHVVMVGNVSELLAVMGVGVYLNVGGRKNFWEDKSEVKFLDFRYHKINE
jgi:hypothetical protein